MIDPFVAGTSGGDPDSLSVSTCHCFWLSQIRDTLGFSLYRVKRNKKDLEAINGPYFDM